MKLRQCVLGCQGRLKRTFERVPDLPASGETIGMSVRGNQILSYTVGSGPRVVLFCGGIHGNEVGTTFLMHHLLQWLHKHPQDISSLTCLVIPCLNPDGFHLALEHPGYFSWGKTGRLNANGVDLNRNFPTESWSPEAQWNHGKEYRETTPVSSGSGPGSEPEVQAFLSLVEHRDIQTVFMFHSVGSDVMGNGITPSDALAQLYAEKAHFRCLPSDHWHQLDQTGTAVEWCNKRGIPCIEVEASQRWGSDWKRQGRALAACIDALH